MTDNHKKILEEFNELIYAYNQGKLHNDLYDMNSNTPLFAITKSMQRELGNFLLEKLQVERESVIEEILMFLDELEMEQPQDLKTDNWRNWKYIRNSIVDKDKLKSEKKINLPKPTK